MRGKRKEKARREEIVIEDRERNSEKEREERGERQRKER